jgi:Fe-S-cluster-containing hydrogenase component 2
MKETFEYLIKKNYFNDAIEQFKLKCGKCSHCFIACDFSGDIHLFESEAIPMSDYWETLDGWYFLHVSNLGEKKEDWHKCYVRVKFDKRNVFEIVEV